MEMIPASSGDDAGDAKGWCLKLNGAQVVAI
jgi:hypothetical protein